MDPIQKLLAIEDIRALMARRVRCLDEKDWAGFAACYTEDAEAYSNPNAPESKVVGAKSIAESVSGHLRDVTTVHQVHIPEIEILSEDSARAIWPLNDILSQVKDGKRRWMHAHGHYRQIYRKIDGRWLIKEHRLTRLLVESGIDDHDPARKVPFG
jgi:uncharacterized protein (TIGR02246 family)